MNIQRNALTVLWRSTKRMTKYDKYNIYEYSKKKKYTSVSYIKDCIMSTYQYCLKEPVL